MNFLILVNNSIYKSDDKWDYYYNGNSLHYDFIKEEINKTNYGNLGKYLLFSSSRESLLKASESIIHHFGLSIFKINKSSSNSGNFAFVSEIYDYDNRYSNLIADFLKTNSEIHYRYWKSEWKTQNKVYSKIYQDNLILNSI